MVWKRKGVEGAEVGGFEIKRKEFRLNLLKILIDLTGMPDGEAGRVRGDISTSAAPTGGAFCRQTWGALFWR